VRAPFGGQAPSGIPLELVSDAVLGDVDTIELACLWSDELGTADAWYRLLNVGVPIAPSAGTDAMVDFFRTMAIGTTRVYVRVPGPLTMDRYLAGLKAGRSFVTNGPLLQFTVGGFAPGDVVTPSDAPIPWELHVASSLPFNRVEVLVNGEVVWSQEGPMQPGAQSYRGTLKAPSGGWIAARAHGGAIAWPAMDSYPFAHTAPLWFGSIGSTDAVAAGNAAKELMAALDVAEQRVQQSYGEAPATTILGRIKDARQKLGAYLR
jgi:TolB protein